MISNNYLQQLVDLLNSARLVSAAGGVLVKTGIALLLLCMVLAVLQSLIRRVSLSRSMREIKEPPEKNIDASVSADALPDINDGFITQEYICPVRQDLPEKINSEQNTGLPENGIKDKFEDPPEKNLDHRKKMLLEGLLKLEQKRLTVNDEEPEEERIGAVSDRQETIDEAVRAL